MKSKLKIHELEIIIDGVDEQWLIQNNKHIIQAIQKAFDPFDSHQFSDEIINEIVIDLPKTTSFNDFLVALVNQIKKQVVERFVLSNAQIAKIKNQNFNSLKWKTVDDLFAKLKEDTNIHSRKYNETFIEISSIIQSNKSVLWEIIQKLGLSKSVFNSFHKWIQTEQIDPRQILIWIGTFLELKKKSININPDKIFLDVILESQFKNNNSKIAFHKINTDFVEILLNSTQPITKEIIEYQNNIKELNSLFSNYFEDFNVIKNLIDIQFIEKIIQINLSSKFQNYNKKKKEIILYYNLLIIASSIGKSKYEQLLSAINLAYLNTESGQFNYLNLLNIFNQHFSSEEYNKIKNLIELIFQETYLINYNNDFDKSLNLIKSKVERYISENLNSSIQSETIIIDKKSSQAKIEVKNIVQHIVDIEFFQSWPKGFSILKTRIAEYISTILATGTATNIAFIESNENAKIVLNEIKRLLIEIRSKSKNNSESFINHLLAHVSVFNYLILNLKNAILENAEIDDETLKTFSNKDKISSVEANIIDIIQNKELLEIWQTFIFEFANFESNNILFNEIKLKIKTESTSGIYKLLSQTTTENFAKNLFQTLISIQKNKNKFNQTLILSYLLGWIENNIENKTSTYIQFDNYVANYAINPEIEKIQPQKIKEKIIDNTLNTINELKNNISKEEIQGLFTEQELKLWNGLIKITEENRLDRIKLAQQFKLFEKTFEIMNELYFENIQTNTEINLLNQYNQFNSVFNDIFELNYNALTLKKYPKQIIDNFEQIINFIKSDPIFIFELYLLEFKKSYPIDYFTFSDSISKPNYERKSPFKKFNILSYFTQLFESGSFVTTKGEKLISDENKSKFIHEIELFQSKIKEEFSLSIELVFENFKNDPIVLKIIQNIELIKSNLLKIENPDIAEKANLFSILAILQILRTMINKHSQKYNDVNDSELKTIFNLNTTQWDNLIKKINELEIQISQQESIIKNQLNIDFHLPTLPNSFLQHQSLTIERQIMESWIIDDINKIKIDDNINYFTWQIIQYLRLNELASKRSKFKNLENKLIVQSGRDFAQNNLENQNVTFISLSEVISIINPKWNSIISLINVNEIELDQQLIKHLGWMDQLLTSPILLKVTKRQSELFKQYLEQISKSSTVTYTLREHLIFKNIFSMLLYFAKQTSSLEFIIENKSIANIVKNKSNEIIANLKSTLNFQENYLVEILITKYSGYKEFEIANESKKIIENLFVKQSKNNTNQIAEWTPKNLWFQTEQKIPFQAIFNNEEYWKVLFLNNIDEIYIENSEHQVQPIWDKSENYRVLIKHPDYKKWLVQLSKNKGEGYMELASTLSFDEIIIAQKEKYKLSLETEIDIKFLLNALSKTNSRLMLLEFYQYVKFQLIQTPSAPTKLQLAQIFYLSYISVSSNLTFTDISNFSKLVTQILKLNNNEVGLLNKLINEKLPNQSNSSINTEKSIETVSKNNKPNLDKQINDYTEFIIKYPYITEKEIVDQINLVNSNLYSSSDIHEILNQISKLLWNKINHYGENIKQHKNLFRFVNKISHNWITNKYLHWTIKYAFVNTETWILTSRDALIKAEINGIKHIHPNWLIYDEKYKSETNTNLQTSTFFYSIDYDGKIKYKDNFTHVYKLNQTNLDEFPFSTSFTNKTDSKFQVGKPEFIRTNPAPNELAEKNIPSIEQIKYTNDEVISEFIEWQNSQIETLEITNKKFIENQQNNEEYRLELPSVKREPSILNWKSFGITSDIEKALLSILLIEGIDLNKTVIPNNKLISTNQFLSSKAIFRILGHSSIPIQFVGLLYEQFFGYSLGFINENWANFTEPQKSKSLHTKLKALRENNDNNKSNKNWFESILNYSKVENQEILSQDIFNLIISEIQQKIKEKLKSSNLNKAHESLQIQWINHLIFFKLIKLETDNNPIGGFFSILKSDANKIDYLINNITDSIIIDIEVEFDFWISNLSKLSNYFEESNIITIFQIYESLKLLNSEIKLQLEDIIESTYQSAEHRPFQDAILNVFIPNLIPIFYENHLTKTNTFRELNLISLIINERNNISKKTDHIQPDISKNLENIFDSYKDLESVNVDPEILREITNITGKNLDETTRWILHELSYSDANKMNQVKQKINDVFESKTKINNYYNSMVNNPKLTQSIQELINPIILNIQDKNKSDSRIKQEVDNGTRFITTLCGLMMLSPFLATLFRRMGLLEKNSFISEAEQLKAYKVLMTIPKIDEDKEYEYQDLIPRIITGIAPEDTIHFIPELTDDELTEIRNFLGAVISQWPVMANATLRGFIESFLIRDGKVWKEGTVWKIEVNGHGADMILQTLTWGFSTMKFPWTPYLIETNWQPA